MDRIISRVLELGFENPAMNDALIVATAIVLIAVAIPLQWGIGYAVFRFVLKRRTGKAMSWAVGFAICTAVVLLAGRNCFLAASTGSKLPGLVCGWRCNDHQEYQGKGKTSWYSCWGESDGTRRDRVAAERGHAEAQAHLGLRYSSGLGVSPDPAEALQWFLKAAEQDVVWAQYEIGRRYMTGQHQPTDYVQAHKWLSLVEMHEGNLFEPNAKEDLATLEPKMTSEQIAEAQRGAREWLEKHRKIE